MSGLCRSTDLEVPAPGAKASQRHRLRILDAKGGGPTLGPKDGPIAIDKVLQQAFVEVDEIGTEAAAVTAVSMMMDLSAPANEPERVVFHADHPFAYVIRDMKTGVVLFAGRVIDP